MQNLNPYFFFVKFQDLFDVLNLSFALPPNSSSHVRHHSCPSALALLDHPENSPSSSSVASSLPWDPGDWLLDKCVQRCRSEPPGNNQDVCKEGNNKTYCCYQYIHSYLEAVLPPPAAATVAGEAPARRSWFCREKSMLYHSAARSTGLGGITRLGFSRTSSTYRERRECVCECVSGRNSFPKLQQGGKKKTKAYLINHLFVTRSITILICLSKTSLHSSISLHSLLKLLPGLSLQS